MAANKFEKHIKEQLNHREIKPSSEAWQKISHQLKESKKPKKNWHKWIGIAASFIGLLLVATIYNNSKEPSSKEENIIFNSQKNNSEQHESKSNLTIEKSKEKAVVDTERKKIKKVEKLNAIKNTSQEITRSRSKQNKIAEIDAIELKSKTKKIENNKAQLIQIKIAEVMAKVDVLQQNNELLTDIEVDSLITQAQKELLFNKIFTPNKSVNAMALLNEVEDELDQSLRIKLFELLKKGIVEARSAVADRNN